MVKGLYKEYFCIVSHWLFLSSAWDWVGVVSNGIMGLIWDSVASFIGYCAGNWFVVVTSMVKILPM